MNEKQRLQYTAQIETDHPTDKKSALDENLQRLKQKTSQDYEKYFSTVFVPPSLKEAKKRGKEEVKYHKDFSIPEEFRGMGNGRKFYIRTYGCQMNEHDTEVMAGIFMALGYEPTDRPEDANVILLNTCAIRENAENKVFGEIGHLKPLKQNNPDLLLGVCGCMSQEESVVNKILKQFQYVDMIFGTHNIHRLPYILKEAYMSKEMVVEVWSKEGDVIENLPKVRKGNIKAWVNIMYGCDKFCTYCIVPYTRGKERSRRPEDIIQEVRHLAAQGYKEITLLGQNVNAYGKDFTDMKYGLGDLMDELRKIDIPRIRFTTSHPRDFDDRLIEVLAKGGNLVEHIHLPVQSGSSEVLKMMARKYTREQYLELVRKIKEAIPGVALTTDIIVGFPNETDEQFEETLSLYREVEFDSAFTFIYSPREGTPAAKMVDNVPMEVKKERLQRLNALVNEISAKKMKEYEGQVVEVLVEGESKNNPDVLAGYTRKNKLVNFVGPKSAIGQLVNVRITEAKTWTLNGEMVEETIEVK
ncbi:tRNA (N6-isopentenyl adenosine(37)-C2)-methylthiotransferase MiaB [Anoxybacillus sp. LAT_35]|nr:MULTISPECIES: tRNA (N6-isopentenyl adenosine(37)-C2)-methylthiotransferase MiaB [Anoxybacillus]MCG6195935.1 tRNA (N6-isopentenyl adenosine(37)-C2)-methylthiotransferase MiaB [Anoxybacillus sp. LAT_38]QAV26652.1 tRNA (N6-isopentenyl adenosine(37)-C2)-methylthiotransferase MiaB [Neobacillus thermocopriae]MBE2905048.1 tRNA (N6-isopentenyl adenosine(37)-C2)-methylthiotransferase MiaB [Anoxybacillus flavithermus]MBE2929670.1 tRNA (N6-isopentenyl adenosine(37)-C2)-methylthiotransferase MiaB [Anoxy